MSEYLTPLIDREIFFGNPKISGGQISPNGEFITFMKPYNGIRNIWIKKVEDDFDNAIPLTADSSRPIGGYFWSRDSKYILFVQDKNGDENYRVYRVDPTMDADPNTGVPTAKDLTPYEGIRAMIYRLSKTNHSEMYIGLNDRDPAWHDVYKVNIDHGKRTLVLQNNIQFRSAVFDLNDDLKLLTRTDPEGGHELLKKVENEWQVFYTCSATENVAPLRFTREGLLYLSSDKGDENDLSSLVLMDIESGNVSHVENDPEGKADFGGAVFSDLTDQLIGTSYTFEKSKIYWRDEAFKKDYDLLLDRYDNAEITFTSGTRDERKWIVFVNRDTDPGSAYLFDRDTKETRIYHL